MHRPLLSIALFAAIVAIGHLSVLVAADNSPANETCKAGDKQCAAPSEKSDEDSLKKELEEIELKKKKLEEKLRKKKELDAKKKEKKEAKPTEEAEPKKLTKEEEEKKAKAEEEEKKHKSTWISPGKGVGSSGSGVCSQANYDACSETEKRLLKARPLALGSGGTSGALVSTKTKSGALVIKAMEKEEDCLVKYLMTESELKDKEEGVFIEVGAGDGTHDSKTKQFETLRKWTGLCIEPHDASFDAIKAERKCKALKLAIGQKEGTKKFSTKSFKLSESGNHAVEVKRLGALIHSENMAKKQIDLLRVNTNGTEMDVFKSIDLTKAKIDTISLPNSESLHPKLDRLLQGAGWHPVITDEKKHKACPDLKTLYRKHFWPTPLEWEGLILNWLSPTPKSWQSQNGIDITLRLENFPTDPAIRKEMELLIQTQRLKVHMFWNGNSIGVYPFKKEKKVIAKPKPKPKGKPKKEDKLAKKEEEEEMWYYDYEIDIPLYGLKINSGRHTLWARLINRDGGTPTGLENTTNFLVCETPSAYMILEARIQGENCLIDDWVDEGEQQEMVSTHGSLAVNVEKEGRIKREQEEWAKVIKVEREAQKKKEEEEKRRCEAGETEFCPKKVVIDDEKPSEEKPAEEKPAEEKPAEEKPAEEKPAEEKPAEEKAEAKPEKAQEKPATEEKPAAEKPAEKPKKGKKGDAKKEETKKEAEAAAKKDEPKKAEAKKDDAKKEEVKKGDAKKEEAKKEEAKKGSAKKEEAKKEKDEAKKEEAKKDDGKKGDIKKDEAKDKKDSKDKKTQPQLTTGKIEVGKSVAGKVSTGEITVSKDSSLQLHEEKNCTDNYGLDPDKPGRSCQDILERSCEEPTNGFYWLNVSDSKELGKVLNRWRLVQARCDMEFNHGGWTRILVCSGSENMPWNTFGEDDFLINRYAVQYLAGNASQVHIRTYNRPDIFVVSVPGAAPIQLLRQGAPLNIPIHNDSDPLHGVKNNWYGSMTHFMSWSTGAELAPLKLEYPQVVYWAANNANGLHIVNQPPPAAAKMVKAGFGRFEGTGSKDKLCGWTLKEWHPIASVQRWSLPTTARKRTKPHSVEDGRGMDALEVYIR